MYIVGTKSDKCPNGDIANARLASLLTYLSGKKIEVEKSFITSAKKGEGLGCLLDSLYECIVEKRTERYSSVKGLCDSTAPVASISGAAQLIKAYGYGSEAADNLNVDLFPGSDNHLNFRC